MWAECLTHICIFMYVHICSLFFKMFLNGSHFESLRSIFFRFDLWKKRAFYRQRNDKNKAISWCNFFLPFVVFVTFSPPLCSLDPAGDPSGCWAAGEPFARQPRAPDIPLAVRQHRRLQQQLDAPAQHDGTHGWAPCTLTLPILYPTTLLGTFVFPPFRKKWLQKC